MNARTISALLAIATFGVSVVTLTHCELAVDLDRSEVDGAVPDGCSICTNLAEGGEDGGEDGSESGPDDAASTAEGASTADAGDATPGEGGPDGALDAAGGG